MENKINTSTQLLGFVQTALFNNSKKAKASFSDVGASHGGVQPMHYHPLECIRVLPGMVPPVINGVTTGHI